MICLLSTSPSQIYSIENRIIIKLWIGYILHFGGHDLIEVLSKNFSGVTEEIYKKTSIVITSVPAEILTGAVRNMNQELCNYTGLLDPPSSNFDLTLPNNSVNEVHKFIDHRCIYYSNSAKSFCLLSHLQWKHS